MGTRKANPRLRTALFYHYLADNVIFSGREAYEVLKLVLFVAEVIHFSLEISERVQVAINAFSRERHWMWLGSLGKETGEDGFARNQCRSSSRHLPVGCWWSKAS